MEKQFYTKISNCDNRIVLFWNCLNENVGIVTRKFHLTVSTLRLSSRFHFRSILFLWPNIRQLTYKTNGNYFKYNLYRWHKIYKTFFSNCKHNVSLFLTTNDKLLSSVCRRCMSIGSATFPCGIIRCMIVTNKTETATYAVELFHYSYEKCSFFLVLVFLFYFLSFFDYM